jgi:pimeloyl-ACP methyl ester carboxylesterase
MNAPRTNPLDTDTSSWLSRHRRRVFILVPCTIVVLILATTAAGWIFSANVLVPDRSGWPTNATVKALPPGQIVLSRSEETQRPGVYGLDWQGGHAIIGETLRSTAHTVTRRLCATDGYLVAGMKAALEHTVYNGNPLQSLGLPYTDVNVSGELGLMPAWFIPGQTNTWAIVVHGINGNPEEDLRIVPALHREGLPSLLITYREDLGAPRSPDGLHHMGLTEWRDLQAAARYALSHGAQRLLLVGYSMGGAITTQFMQHSPLASHVAGLLLDAPALDWKAILAFNAREMGLASFAADPVEWMIGERIHADWNDLDALRHAGDFHLPILLFHGMQDKLVPISSSDEFAKELPRWVTYYRVPKAGHTEAWNVDPELYEQRVSSFLSRTLHIPLVTPPHRGQC